MNKKRPHVDMTNKECLKTEKKGEVETPRGKPLSRSTRVEGKEIQAH